MTQLIERDVLIAAIEQSWEADTSYDANEWSDDNPARGQCVVTALVLQEYLGGDILRFRTQYEGQLESHFKNVLESGEVLDLTCSQYPTSVEFEEAPMALRGYASIRARLLGNAETARKYLLFKERVSAVIDER